MALLAQSARPNQTSNRDRQKVRLPRARGRVKADRLKLCRSPKNRSEKSIAAVLIDAGIEFRYEPESFKTGRPGKRQGEFHPDFYLPDYDLYLEVTQGDDFKQSFLGGKIDGTQRKNNVRILLIGPRELENLRRRPTSITRLIEVFLAYADESASSLAA